MVDLRTATAALRKVWGQCQAVNPNLSLRAQLQVQSDAQFDVVGAGGVVGVSGNGHDVRFESSSKSTLTPQTILGMWVFLVERFDSSKVELVQAGNPNPSDTQVEADMESKMRPVYGYTDNWMYMTK